MKKLLMMSIMSLSLLANNQISNDEIESINKGIENLIKLKNSANKKDKIKPYVVVGLSTNHLFEESENILNEHNNLIGVGVEYKKYELTYLHFDNSLYQKTNAILFRKNVDIKWNISYNYGVSIVVGYEKDYVLHKNGMKYTAPNNFVICDNVGIMPTIGLTYNTKHVDLNCDLFGNALITSVKYKF